MNMPNVWVLHPNFRNNLTKVLLEKLFVAEPCRIVLYPDLLMVFAI